MTEPLSDEKRLQMAAVLAALEADRDGAPIEAVCPVCNETLTVTHLPDLGRTTVACKTGCTTSHMSYAPKVVGAGASNEH